MSTRLKIAVQKSGRLLDGSLELLRECGIKIGNGEDRLKVQAGNYPLEAYFLRNSDIPQYVHDGIADIAIIGENTVIEKEKPLRKIMSLGFSKCRLSIAVPKTADYDGIQWLQGKRIATSYPNTVRAFLQKNNIQADIHEISGSVEIAPNIGLADAICDLVSTGSTLFKNNLVEKDVVLQSEAWIVANPNLSAEAQEILDQLIFRIKAVMTAASNKYLLMNAPNDRIEEIIRILPGMKSPTVMPLATEGWSSIHTVIQEERFWEIIDELRLHGAQGILVIPIQKMIL
ncbi:MAG: ATP phosphoribosyltransferase [Lewinellaceae bacterium]|nr:ATP phosphoribosyltransferase [Lewinellaceae bacterium]